MPPVEITVWHVLIASGLTALCTGLGIIPFLFVDRISNRFLGIGNSLAAGLMMGASIGLIYEAHLISDIKLAVGLAIGAALIVATRALFPDDHDEEESLTLGLESASFRKMLMIMAVMTAHSFAEGIGVGVSFGGREGFGELISSAIAIHNIPEGIAIALVMIPRGVSKVKTTLWSIFSSLPQPLMAVPAFLFVLVFEPLLPIGLGLAAGAMIYMVFVELLPEALEHVKAQAAIPVCLLATAAMLAFQWLL